MKYYQDFITQSSFVLTNIKPEKSRNEYLRYMSFVVDLDDMISEQGQIVQQYAKADLYISIISLLQYLLESEKYGDQELLQIITHPGVQACFNFINIFRNQLTDVEPVLQIENGFYEQAHNIFQWFIHYYPSNTFENEIGQLLKYALDTLISFFSFIVKEYGVQICIKFF